MKSHFVSSSAVHVWNTVSTCVCIDGARRPAHLAGTARHCRHSGRVSPPRDTCACAASRPRPTRIREARRQRAAREATWRGLPAGVWAGRLLLLGLGMIPSRRHGHPTAHAALCRPGYGPSRHPAAAVPPRLPDRSDVRGSTAAELRDRRAGLGPGRQWQLFSA